ncbi:MAG: ABC transporter substrate-binding protein [Bacteroidota bacterium]
MNFILKISPEFWSFLICFSLLISCHTENESSTATETTTSTTKDYFPEKVKVQHAKNFTVSYHNNYKVVRTSATLGDWGSAMPEVEDLEDVMVLVQKGTTAPALTGDLEGATIITIPTDQKIATNYPGIETWLEMLGLSENIVAIGGTKTYDDVLRNKLLNDEIGEVGYSWAAPPNMEVLLGRQPDIFLMVLSQIRFGGSLPKLRQLDVPAVPVFDWAERDYLGRAEWIKYCALFFNKEQKANEIFEEIEERVSSLKALATTAESKPVCLWGHFVDGGFWMANANNTEARLLKDAGVINPVEDFTLPFNPVGEPFTNEEWLEVGKDAEHWIISNGVMGVRLPSKRYLTGFEAWQNGNLYHQYLRSKPEHDAYDWFNLGPVRPDFILADLIALLHPELLPEHDFVFFGELEKEEL